MRMLCRRQSTSTTYDQITRRCGSFGCRTGHRTGVGCTVPGMTEIGTDWRVVDGVATAWFDAPSLIEGAALAGRIAELSPGIVVDLRATGIRVRLDSDGHAEAVSSAARDLALAANPAVLQ